MAVKRRSAKPRAKAKPKAKPTPKKGQSFLDSYGAKKTIAKKKVAKKDPPSTVNGITYVRRYTRRRWGTADAGHYVAGNYPRYDKKH